LEDVPQSDQPFRASPVEPAGAIAALVKQTGVLQYREMLADRRTGDFERRRDLARGEFVVGHELQDGAPARFGQGPQHRVGALADRFWFANPFAHRQLRTSGRTHRLTPVRSWSADSAKTPGLPGNSARLAAGTVIVRQFNSAFR
jgi:hypothetical protein